MKLNFSCLRLDIDQGAWNEKVNCNGELLDHGIPVATVNRDGDTLFINIGQTEIKVFGKLPTSRNGGEGKLTLQETTLASFKCEIPYERWAFSDLDGKETTIIKTLSLAKRLAIGRTLN